MNVYFAFQGREGERERGLRVGGLEKNDLGCERIGF